MIGERAIWCNTGGPMSRTRTERLVASLLGQDDGPIRCPRVLKVGLDYETDDLEFLQIGPLMVIEAVAEIEGIRRPDDCKVRYADRLPKSPMLAYPVSTGTEFTSAYSDAYGDVLFMATLLGLCTATYYDPDRPVVWTSTSLNRRLELFRTEGFYAMD